MNMTPFIEVVLAVAGVFAVCATIETVKHVQDSSAIKSQTAQGIQAIVAIAELSMAGSMAEESVEIHSVPVPNLTTVTKSQAVSA